MKKLINSWLLGLFRYTAWHLAINDQGLLTGFNDPAHRSFSFQFRLFSLKNPWAMKLSLADHFDDTITFTVALPFLLQMRWVYECKPPAWITRLAGQYNRVEYGFYVNREWARLAWRCNYDDYLQNKGWSRSVAWDDWRGRERRKMLSVVVEENVPGWIPLVGTWNPQMFLARIVTKTVKVSYRWWWIRGHQEVFHEIFVDHPPSYRVPSEDRSGTINSCITHIRYEGGTPMEALGRYVAKITEYRRVRGMGEPKVVAEMV